MAAFWRYGSAGGDPGEDHILLPSAGQDRQRPRRFLSPTMARVGLAIGAIAAVALIGIARNSGDSPMTGVQSVVKEVTLATDVAFACEFDEAADNRSPPERAGEAFLFRENAAKKELLDGDVCHFGNGDEFGGDEPKFFALFHKTLPHNEFGEVNPDDYNVLKACVEEADINLCESIPVGLGRTLANPLAGRTIMVYGPDTAALPMKAPPSVSSPELAAQLAEVYWMALVRDIHFCDYDTNLLLTKAAGNLAGMPGFTSFDIVKNDDGSIDPLRQLFRTTYPGVDKGPMVSQFLLKSYSVDSIEVQPLQETFIAGLDYMTDFQGWLDIQNGYIPETPEETERKRLYIRNARDMSRLSFTDRFYSEAFRALNQLINIGAISGSTGPYVGLSRQGGFTTFGISHAYTAMGKAEDSQRISWYQKWNVFRLLRPETMAGLVHLTVTGARWYELDHSILENWELLDLIAVHNKEQNAKNGRTQGATFLLPMSVKEGSPAHPSYPAGHSVSNGAYVTVLKAFVGLEEGQRCIEDPVVASATGLTLDPYTPLSDEICIDADGNETYGLTIEGELNKMATNIAFGRSMIGVHFRGDNTEGMKLGETQTIRVLQQEILGLPESSFLDGTANPASMWRFRTFIGDVIQINGDGSFSINDGVPCFSPYTEAAAISCPLM